MPGQFEEMGVETLTHELRQRKPLPYQRNRRRDDDERRACPSPHVMQACVGEVHVAVFGLRRIVQRHYETPNQFTTPNPAAYPLEKQAVSK